MKAELVMPRYFARNYSQHKHSDFTVNKQQVVCSGDRFITRRATCPLQLCTLAANSENRHNSDLCTNILCLYVHSTHNLTYTMRVVLFEPSLGHFDEHLADGFNLKVQWLLYVPQDLQIKILPAANTVNSCISWI